MYFPFDLYGAAMSDSHLPCHTHAMPRPCRSSQGHGIARPSFDGRAVALRRTAWACMASVNQTRPHCVNQMRKTHSKHLVARHGRGTAWARYAMCESALNDRFRHSLHTEKLVIVPSRYRRFLTWEKAIAA